VIAQILIFTALTGKVASSLKRLQVFAFREDCFLEVLNSVTARTCLSEGCEGSAIKLAQDSARLLQPSDFVHQANPLSSVVFSFS
jgi:hypothetical protein